MMESPYGQGPVWIPKIILIYLSITEFTHVHLLSLPRSLETASATENAGIVTWE